MATKKQGEEQENDVVRKEPRCVSMLRAGIHTTEDLVQWMDAILLDFYDQRIDLRIADRYIRGANFRLNAAKMELAKGRMQMALQTSIPRAAQASRAARVQ